MKHFFAVVLGTIVGRVISTVLGLGVLLLVLLFASVFGGHSSSSDETQPLTKGAVSLHPSTAPEATEAPATTPTTDPTGKRADVETVARESGLVPDVMTESQAWDLAQKTCNSLDSGRYWNDVKSSNEAIALFQGRAVHVLCPFHDTSVEFG